MEPAQYEIPLVVWPPRRRPWQRLYLTPTHSSAAHAKTHGNPHNHAHEEERARDSLEWTLRAEYDHEKDLFRDKPATLRRSGRDGRLCQEDLTRRTVLREVREALQEGGEWQEESGKRLEGETTHRSSSTNNSQTHTNNNGSSVVGVRPRVVRVRTRDSLVTSLLYTPRPTHTLTMPKAAPGYARNPNGAFFTS
ncbi:uncharacterized protein LOC121871199 isoform X1 [Homarus americanus]|uniref:uncharacterized protein LOC121871199 isoform X1 n=1 Tax=Homarus americanus TaxID=6706 RepID=UPI001C4658AC|nr:uncharacterized protein LOC121871199 isoform X1 [Homarus americanus]